jgi:hypothetical protein
MSAGYGLHDEPEPPFGADGESMPITALAMPIRVFCAPPADHAAEITDPLAVRDAGSGLELAAPVWRSVSGTQVNRAAWLLGPLNGLAARVRRLCVRAAGLARRMSARFARAGQRSQVRRHLQA